MVECQHICMAKQHIYIVNNNHDCNNVNIILMLSSIHSKEHAQLWLRYNIAYSKVGKHNLTVHYGTRGSQVIPQLSTSLAQPRLTSEF